MPETYWETSLSGTGLHGIFCAKRTFPPISQPGTEVYSDNHFMSVTGLCVNGVSAIAKVTPRTFDFIRKPAEPVVSPSNDASKVYSGLGADIVIESFHQ